jgi:hypothetical protein
MKTLPVANWISTVAIVILTLVVVSEAAFSQVPATDPCSFLKGSGKSSQLANCKTIVAQNLIPNQKALAYTIWYWVNNQNSLKDPTCGISGIDPKDRCENCVNPSWIAQGFTNTCSFIMNDLEQEWAQDPQPGRSTAYFVDLCAKNSSQLVTSFYVNGGTGPRYDDTPDNPQTKFINKSTLAGAFLLDNKIRGDFWTTHPEKYAEITAENNGNIPSVRAIGLNSSNNSSESWKPFHLTPFRTGWGCLAVNKSNLWIMKNMVARGTSLFMNYTSRYEQRGSSCVND